MDEDLCMFDPELVPAGIDTDAALAALADEPATGALWDMTAQVLSGRAGWRLNYDDEGTYAWFFGLEGQGLLAVTVEPTAFSATTTVLMRSTRRTQRESFGTGRAASRKRS